MAQKIKLTRPELKRQRDLVARFRRYLPMLKLKQQQLQLAMRELEKRKRQLLEGFDAVNEKFNAYKPVLNDISGVNVKDLARSVEIITTEENIAGVNVPLYQDAKFAEPSYSLFATPVWVDAALEDLREINRFKAKLDILEKRREILKRELARTLQRVNLFEKVKIPESLEAMRKIRIHLGDEMTAAVGRAKIAKDKQLKEDQAA